MNLDTCVIGGVLPAGGACAAALPPAASDGSRTMTFQAIGQDSKCGSTAQCTDPARAVAYLAFYDANGGYLGRVSYPTIAAINMEASQSLNPVWESADGTTTTAAFQGAVTGQYGWAGMEGSFWEWLDSAACTCDVTDCTQNFQGVLWISPDGDLQVSPGPSSPATAVLGSGTGAISYDTGGALASAAYVGFGGASSPQLVVTAATAGVALNTTTVPPPWAGIAAGAIMLILFIVLAVALATIVIRGRARGERDFDELEVEAKAAGATTLTVT